MTYHIVIIAIICLAAISLIRHTSDSSSTRLWPSIIFFSFFLFASMVAIRYLPGILGYIPNTSSMRVVKYAISQANLSRKVDNIIIIDGGSYTSRGLNNVLLSKLLHRSGYNSIVIPLYQPATEHLERFQMHQYLLDHFNERQTKRLQQANLVLMTEICLGYDHKPFSMLLHNIRTKRAISYAGPANIYHGLNACLFHGGKLNSAQGEASIFTSILDIGTVLLINTSNYSLFDRLIEEEHLRQLNAFRPIKRKPKPLKPRDERVIFRSPTKANSKLYFPWIDDIRDQRLADLYASLLDHHIEFLPPTSSRSNFAYAENRLRHNPKRLFILPDRDLSLALKQESLWHDDTHLRAKGSTVYTRWLADKLIKSGILIK